MILPWLFVVFVFMVIGELLDLFQSGFAFLNQVFSPFPSLWIRPTDSLRETTIPCSYHLFRRGWKQCCPWPCGWSSSSNTYFNSPRALSFYLPSPSTLLGKFLLSCLFWMATNIPSIACNVRSLVWYQQRSSCVHLSPALIALYR